MEVLDSTALAKFLIANPDLAEECLPPHLMGAEVLSTTLCDVAYILFNLGFSRKKIADHLSNAIVSFEVEDQTLLLLATTMFARSFFTFPECIEYVYCLLDDREPHFENECLQRSFDTGEFFGDLKK
ncbi:MAG: hypothetical protein II721_07265 [Bacilli bacterium]|nr:hypothetical protein [Bacilli bacterium]